MRLVAVNLAGVADWSKRMIKIASMSLDKNLSSYSNYLKGIGIVHRITEESGSLSIYVANPDDLSEAKHMLDLYMNDQLEISDNLLK